MKRVTPAISKGIADNKETMIDALYPIMGGMISKYVTQAIKELMDSINQKIENGFSFERYKRKAKAKFTGVSESELLLEESSSAQISSLFVIHKETSLLIADAHLKHKEIDDPHMIASMASAIKDFVNDWSTSNETLNEVQILSYGNATLYIESAGSVFIIAFLDAEPDFEQRKDINTFFAMLVKKYADFFQIFDGDDSVDEVTTLSHTMQMYLASLKTNKEPNADKTNIAKYIIYIFALLVVVYVLVTFNKWYINHTLEQTIHSQTGEKVFISQENEHFVISGQVSSLEMTNEIHKIMKRSTKLPLKNNLLVSMEHIDEQFKKEEKNNQTLVHTLENKLLFLEKKFSTTVSSLENKIVVLKTEVENSKTDLDDTLQNTKNEIVGLKKEKVKMQQILEIKSEIFAKLDNALLANEHYDQNKHKLDFYKLALFSAGKAVYEKDAIVELGKTVDTYLGVLVDYKEYIKHIIIEGHTDSSGIEEDNYALSNKRALVVKYYLNRLKIIKQYHMQGYLKTTSYGSTQAVIINGIEDKNASRRIDITFELDENRIVNNLRELIND